MVEREGEMVGDNVTVLVTEGVAAELWWERLVGSEGRHISGKN